MPRITLASPVGLLWLEERQDALVALGWGEDETIPPPGAGALAATPLLAEAALQLAAYFAGARQGFDLPLAPGGTNHQARVWAALREIPFGRSESYGALAARVGSSARSVGTACSRNPLPILIPCHRVLAAGGAQGGYSGRGGLETKRRLLALEGVPLPGETLSLF
ncbi:cysteine methyltransferase [Rhodospirillum rubrum]|uniref:methylated-DNA--[protein]-cysteine S-methyltransferase n=1 Tax=Rhodospirillum rubrum TaxID=1085 RepID=UPI0019034E8D|nr:methylated-DNA--[protein]-cysteine S-methyltransferase [Rhodospirillum rubrum]MBK1663227.1 cysteine methyltransferase [Rhodospirillum rubrum]MBK1676944.1 cysteine methyltransferase [Rhodospirillum rubrum]